LLGNLGRKKADYHPGEIVHESIRNMIPNWRITLCQPQQSVITTDELALTVHNIENDSVLEGSQDRNENNGTATEEDANQEGIAKELKSQFVCRLSSVIFQGPN